MTQISEEDYRMRMRMREGNYPCEKSLAVRTSLWDDCDLVENWCEQHAESYYPEYHGDHVWIYIWFKEPSDKTLFILRFV